MHHFPLLMASTMAACASSAGYASQCPANTVPIQITDEARRGSETLFSAAELSDPHFRAFVMAVTEHIATRLVRDKLCIGNANGKETSLLRFVSWPLATSGERSLAPVPPLDARPSGGCRISSPWIDLAFERTPIPWVRGIVRWNERQLLVDQAVLAGSRDVPADLTTPLRRSEFEHFAWDYADSEILRQPATRPIEERIPPDLLWLFRRSWQSTRGPFPATASGAMNKAVEKGSEGYTKLVIALIDRCFASDGEDLHYSSILDVADLISLDQYRIDTPLR